MGRDYQFPFDLRHLVYFREVARHNLSAWLCRELDPDVANQSRGPGIAKQPMHGRAAALAIVEREAVHVHSDEPIGASLIETASGPECAASSLSTCAFNSATCAFDRLPAS